MSTILRASVVALALVLSACSGGASGGGPTAAVETFAEVVEAPDGYEFGQPTTEQVAAMGNITSGTVAIRNIVRDDVVIGVLIAFEATEFEADAGRNFAEGVADSSGASVAPSQDHGDRDFEVYRLEGGSGGWVASRHPFTLGVFPVEGGDVLPLSRILFDRL